MTNPIGERIRLEAARKRLSQAELGAAIGVTQQAVSRRLADDSRLRATEVERIAELLGVSVSFLYGEPAPARELAS